MEQPKSLEQIRQEVKEAQETILWPDNLMNGRSVDAFLWHPDSKAKPIQRAGLLVFAAAFWLMGVLIAALSLASDEWGGKIIGSLLGLSFILLSIRLFFNAFLKPKQTSEASNDEEKG